MKSRYPFIKRASSFYRDGHERESGYDYIIVGGGTAGCPLAATLSQNFSVLLLERGGVPFTNANVSFLRNFHIGLADTSSTSASQAFASTDGVINARARVLGGGSAINAGFYTRASTRYFDFPLSFKFSFFIFSSLLSFHFYPINFNFNQQYLSLDKCFQKEKIFLGIGEF